LESPIAATMQVPRQETPLKPNEQNQQQNQIIPPVLNLEQNNNNNNDDNNDNDKNDKHEKENVDETTTNKHGLKTPAKDQQHNVYDSATLPSAPQPGTKKKKTNKNEKKKTNITLFIYLFFPLFSLSP